MLLLLLLNMGKKWRKEKRREKKESSIPFPNSSHQGLVQAQKLHVNLRTVPVSTALNSPQQPHLLLRCIPWASPAVVTDSNRHQKKEEEKTGTQDKGSSSHLPSDPTRVPRSGGQGPQVNGMEGGRGNGDCQEVGREGSEGTWAPGRGWLLHPICPFYDSPRCNSLHSGEPDANN